MTINELIEEANMARDMKVALTSLKGDILETTLEDLLPVAYTPEDLHAN